MTFERMENAYPASEFKQPGPIFVVFADVYLIISALPFDLHNL